MPSPKKEDILFRGDLPDWHNNACLNVRPTGDELAYTEGYRRAARCLVEHVSKTGRSQDFLVYPVIFLYRHNIELCLKEIIQAALQLLNRNADEKQKKNLNGHRLDDLWRDAKSLLSEVATSAGWQNLPKSDVDGIESYIRQISIIDPQSFSFRYARSKKGEKYIPPQLHHINLRHFLDHIETLVEYLDGLSEGLNSLLETQAEMYSAFEDAI